jgi:hypothetical protein
MDSSCVILHPTQVVLFLEANGLLVLFQDADDFGLKCDPEILSKLLLDLSHGWKNL